MAPLLGLVCGATDEAAALGPLRRDPRLIAVVSGARPDAAEAAARRCVGAGCRALLSFGVAGALSPELGPGALLAPAFVVDEAAARWCIDPRLSPPRGHPGALLGLDRVAGSAVEKAALRRQTGAAAVDMESHRTAAVAAEAGIAFGVLRVVLDPAAVALPRAAAGGLRPNGRADPLAVVSGLLRRPAEAAAFVRLICEWRIALPALAEAAAEMLPAILDALEADQAA